MIPSIRCAHLPGLAAFVLGTALAATACALDESASDGSKPMGESPSVPGWTSLATANAQLAGGADEVTLSTDGSWKYKRTRTGGVVTREETSYLGYEALAWDHAGPSSKGTWKRAPLPVTERRYEVARAAGNDGKLVVTDDPEDDGKPRARVTFTRVGDKVHAVVETADPLGALKVTGEFDTTPGQALMPRTPADTFDASCSGDLPERIQPAIVEGVTRGLQCLDRLGLSAELSLLASKLASQGVRVRCAPLPNNECASVDFMDSIMRGSLDGPIGITVDANTFFNNVFCESNQASGMFHELLHVAFGPHKPGFTASNDRVYACQRLCFNGDPTSAPQVTRCQCATCLGTDECDPRCVNFPECSKSPTNCDPQVAISNAVCSPAACSCGMAGGKRAINVLSGRVSGPVGTKLQVNLYEPLGGAIMCGDWTESACAVPGVLKCCERVNDTQPEATEWVATQPYPSASECVCPASTSIPGPDWVAQAIRGDKQVEVDRTGPPCN